MAAARALTTTLHLGSDDEITTRRCLRQPGPESEELASRQTTKIGKVDARLIAIARGEIEPDSGVDLFVIDDPFGGLIPVYDDEPSECLDDWLLLEPAIPHTAVPRLCMQAAELVALPLDHRTGFLLSHIDGQRTVEEVIDVSHLRPDDTIEVLAALVDLGAIAID
jgi:hypothetical protein